MSGGKIVETMLFFICFTLRFFQFLKLLRAFPRQWNCSPIPVFSDYWWPPSTLIKRSSNSLASKALVRFSFDPQSTNQQQRNCPNSWSQSFFSEYASLSNKNLNWAILIEFCCMSLLVQFTPKDFSRERRQHKQLISFATLVADEIKNFCSWIELIGSLSTGAGQSTDKAIIR